ncbi:hypothetical protein VB716_00110 [Synechococcus sp. CCY9201]|uniref:hypothetical protein n=1 Tax=Synechococcus sp. CCY9201 TaxID=174697 RepID=UPI002B211C49|nr:hypothetical protein [Synechococcus sp. CCY9201]MEA5472625.1 hypothetical protein [Synechococcus sp. CCY9201]
MAQITLHIGAPRTGTTVLQKYIFPHIQNSSYCGKRPHHSALMHSWGLRDAGQFFAGLPAGGMTQELREQALRYILTMSFHLAQESPPREDAVRAFLSEAISRLVRVAVGGRVLLSTERLLDTAASLNGSHLVGPGRDVVFPVHPLAKACTAAGFTPRIVVCLREPVSYLASKYSRTYFQRTAGGLPAQSPREYIQSQSELESTLPGSSVLSVAEHTPFLKAMHALGFVKAVGFKELIGSDDVLGMLGLENEGKYSFQQFPVENDLGVNTAKKALIMEKIHSSLDQCGWLERVKNAQMYD